MQMLMRALWSGPKMPERRPQHVGEAAARPIRSHARTPSPLTIRH